MGTRDKSAAVDFSGVLEQDTEDALKAAAQISMGTEISDEDLSNIIALCDQVCDVAHVRVRVRVCVCVCVCARARARARVGVGV
jgi:nucleolar protein 58